MIWLEDFLALKRTGNFSRAAVLRNVTQPALSRRIRALEAWAGVVLFERTAQPIVLTAAGRCFEPAAEDMLRRVARTRQAVQAAAQTQAETLRFAATHVLSFSFFPRWFPRFAASATAAVQLASDSLRACEQRMLLGHVQFLLCHAHPAAPNAFDASGYRWAQVGADALCLVAAPALAGGAEDRAPMLDYSLESGLGRIVAATRPHGRATPPAFTSHLAAALRTLALDGRGAAWLPESLIRDDLGNGTLVRLGREPDIVTTIRLYRPDEEQDAPAERFWADLCASRPGST